MQGQAVLSSARLDNGDLPPAVARLRARILQAARSGSIDDLLIPIQWNEVPPLFQPGQPRDFDPLAFLKRQSFDGQGREMLAILSAVFRSPHAVLRQGATQSYVWPVFPAVPAPTPWPQQRLAPWTCVRFADLQTSSPDGGPLVHRTAIGPDGTWHYFWTVATGWPAPAPGSPMLAPGQPRR
ncbi:hypothetical protein P7D22_11970 [Lichenihabitans sp. Uapishka_5]|uniref:hypothetical protein n=1 Tax=Lichenihabitans sp. Uapishka_5 TaxID=3037302 RepID=UPI0029E7F7AC|nr:hypothetical protein [Lichenihabitans sp. Uapishka_5]MDX7951887.1 hypothetical protein [Lichenihabitans sp. Uapishka_5]